MITNTIPEFLDLYHERNPLSLQALELYYEKYPAIFNEYFNYHCPRTEERLSRALDLYPDKIHDISTISELLPDILLETQSAYNQRFNTNLRLNFNLLVGGFGSNAFVERKIIGELYFAAEKLSAKPDHLRIIAAHEIGHIFHNALSQERKMDWRKVEWTDGLFTMYREGAATYLSKVICPGFREDIYYSYNDKDADWLRFYKENISGIKKRFLQDAKTEWTFEKEREWFRLSGGQYFGYNRLGYFLGTSYFDYLVQEAGLEDAIIYWNENEVRTSVIEWLKHENVQEEFWTD
ncbi:DUF5700 domain-containing putative Zn-dependent protease [Bacillus sp. AK031]